MKKDQPSQPKNDKEPKKSEEQHSDKLLNKSDRENQEFLSWIIGDEIHKMSMQLKKEIYGSSEENKDADRKNKED